MTTESQSSEAPQLGQVEVGPVVPLRTFQELCDELCGALDKVENDVANQVAATMGYSRSGNANESLARDTALRVLSILGVGLSVDDPAAFRKAFR